MKNSNKVYIGICTFCGKQAVDFEEVIEPKASPLMNGYIKTNPDNSVLGSFRKDIILERVLVEKEKEWQKIGEDYKSYRLKIKKFLGSWIEGFVYEFILYPKEEKKIQQIKLEGFMETHRILLNHIIDIHPILVKHNLASKGKSIEQLKRDTLKTFRVSKEPVHKN